MGKVHNPDIPQWQGPPQDAGGGNPPYDGGMEERVKALEDFANMARERLARIEATMATKEDAANIKVELHKAIGDQTWKFIGTVMALGVAIVGAMVWIAQNVR